ncbi:MAG TPA: GNVR domain-containing protein [Burkholderiales bacterium]|nr:GNVR domain-containing protein [Burkholderiales bacterium]
MSFGQFLTVLRARSALILMVLIIALGAGVGVTLLLPKRYDATAIVVVDQAAAASSSAGTNAPAARMEDVMSTHLDIIASPAVALRVTEMLDLANNPDVGALLAESRLLSLVWRPISQLLALAEEGSEEEELDLKDWMINRLLRNLEVRAKRDSQLIRITYSGPDGEFSATVANAFVKSYLEIIRRLQADPAKENARQFDEQIKGLKQALEQSEAKLAKFQQAKGIIATDERMDLENTRLSEMSAQLAVAQSQSYESQARQRQLREFLAGGKGEAPSEVSSSPVVQQLKQSVSEREAKLAELAKRVGPNHPQYVAASTELEGLRGRLREEMRMAAQGVLTSSGVAPEREGSLRAAVEQQRTKVLRLKNVRNDLAVLMREADSAKQAYDSAVQRFNQTRMASEVAQASGTVVHPADTPTRPTSPKPSLNIALALALGLAVGIGIALYREAVDGYVRSTRDIVEVLGVPVFAVLAPKGRGNMRLLERPKVYALPKG